MVKLKHIGGIPVNYPNIPITSWTFGAIEVVELDTNDINVIMAKARDLLLNHKWGELQIQGDGFCFEVNLIDVI